MVKRQVTQHQIIRLSSENLELARDSMQDMMLLYSNVALLTRVGTDGIVDVLHFDDISESFSYERFLVPKNSESEHPACKRHFDYLPS